MKFFKYLFFVIFLFSIISINKVFAEDTTPPVISGVTSTNITINSADITWTTDEYATSLVEYGETIDLGHSIEDLAKVRPHIVSLTGLNSNTTYYFCVSSTDKFNNTSRECGFTFLSLSETPEDVTPPVISDISVSNITVNSADITWTTDEVSTSKVLYGLTQSYGLTMGSNDLVISHTVTVINLSENTQYNFQVKSIDGSNNFTLSGNSTFTTASSTPPDTSSPIISSIVPSSINHQSAVISWVTNEDSSSMIEYGTSDSYGSFTTLDSNLVTHHTQTISGLTPDTHYHFRVISSDASSNSSTSSDQSFTTLPDLIIVDNPAVIGEVTVGNISQSSATITWTTNENTYSKVEYGTTSAYCSETNLTTTLSKTHSHTLTDLSNNTTYHFRVVAKDSGENYSYSTDQSFNTIPNYSGSGASCSVLITPTVLTDENNIKASFKIDDIQAIGLDKLIMFNWSKSEDVDYKGVRFVRSSTHYPVDHNDGVTVYDGEGTIFSDLNLVNGKTYYYSIFSYDKDMTIRGTTNLAIAPYAEKRHYHVLSISSIGKADSSFHLTKDLSFGDIDDEVGHAQELLAIDPTLYSEGLITGFFGPKTKQAIEKLQKKYNLPVDGKIDAKVREVLLSLGKNHSLTEHEHKDNIKALSTDIKLGMQGDEVEILQHYLMEQGYLDIDKTTGYFGILTKEAVIKFQKKNNITPAFGYVGPVTRAKILENVTSIPGEEVKP